MQGGIEKTKGGKDRLGQKKYMRNVRRKTLQRISIPGLNWKEKSRVYFNDSWDKGRSKINKASQPNIFCRKEEKRMNKRVTEGNK